MMPSVFNKLLFQLVSVTRSPVAWMVLLGFTSYVLWDWGWATAELWGRAILHIVMVSLFVGLWKIAPKYSTDTYVGKSTLSEAERQHVFHNVNTLFHKLLAISFITVLLLFITILSYRENWEVLTSAIELFADFPRIIFPGVGDIPQRMAEEGFTTRFEVTQTAAAIGYSAACICLVCAAWTTAKFRKFMSRDWRPASHVVFLFLSPVALFTLYAITFVLFDHADVSIKPRPRSIFESFETSDLSLLFKMLIHPMTFLCTVGLLWGLFWGCFRNSLSFVFRRTKNWLFKAQWH